MVLKQAQKVATFTNSIGVNVHVGYWYYSDLAAVKATLLDLGVKHIRDGGRNNIPKLKELGAAGIKTLLLTNPFQTGDVPNSSYAITRYDNETTRNVIIDTSTPKWTPNQLAAAIGVENLDGIEAVNEIDLNITKYKWSQADQTTLSSDLTSPYSWVKYIDKYVRDMNAALSADPLTANVPVVAASLGATYTFDRKSPMLPIGDACDFGNVHYYENGGNGFNNGATYAGIVRYYANTSFPGNLAGRKIPGATPGEGEFGNSALLRHGVEQPYNGVPLYVTECGWHTGSSPYAINYDVHGKYVPRTFVEYFRLGFARSYWYELISASSNQEGVGDRENSFGLLQRNMVYKPGAVQLKAMMSILGEYSDNRPSVDSLDYTLSHVMPAGYTQPGHVRDVLLQKANGDFVLMIYHNIASASVANGGRSETLTHPDVVTTLTLPEAYKIKNTTLRSDAIAPTTVDVGIANTYTFNVNDTVTIIELSKAPVYTLASLGDAANASVDTSIANEVSLKASGSDIWGTADQGSFYYKQASTSVPMTFEVNLASLTSTGANFAKAGIMLRESLDANAKTLMVSARSTEGIYVQARNTVGGSMVNLQSNLYKKLAEVLRVTLDGTTLTVSTGNDAASMAVVYVDTAFTFAPNYLVGVAATSRDVNQVATAKFIGLPAA